MNILINAHPYLYVSILSSFKSLNKDFSEISLQLVDNYNYEAINIKADPQNTYYFFGNGAFNNYGRIKVFSELMAVGIKPQAFFHFTSMVHDPAKVAIGSAVYSNVIIEENSSIGFNTIIAPNVIISKNVTIGNNWFIGPNSIIEEGVSIESNSYITSSCKINEKIKIGKDVVIRDSKVISESIITGTIIDSSIGDFVQIIR